MYAESVSELQAVGQAAHAEGLDAADQPSERESVDPEDLRQLRARLSQVEEALEQKLRENESLRSRIRKLAVE